VEEIEAIDQFCGGAENNAVESSARRCAIAVSIGSFVRSLVVLLPYCNDFGVAPVHHFALKSTSIIGTDTATRDASGYSQNIRLPLRFRKKVEAQIP
jgi:hypothetical protein